MQLQLSRDSTTNTILSLDGHPLYHVHTPGILTRRTTTIYKISETDAQRYEKSEKTKKIEPNAEDEIARIHWHTLHSSKMIYDGKSVELSKFLQPKGFWGDDRVFTGPDGKPYKWRIGLFTSKLEVNDGNKPTKVVAKLRQGNFLTRKKAVFEVDESVSHMLDLVVITFVFVETKRRDREKRQHSHGSGGP